MGMVEGVLEGGGGRALGKMCFLLLVGLLILFAGATVYTGMHAVIKHGADALKVQQACNSKNPEQIWQQSDMVYHCLYDLDNGKTGDQVVLLDEEGNVIEKTSFIPKGGDLTKIVNWLDKVKGALRIWPK
jgi:hypothetical protein